MPTTISAGLPRTNEPRARPSDAYRHPECRPQIRAHLEAAGTIIVLDLAASSARNLVALEEEHDLHRARLRLRVTDRGRWGEVSFEVLQTGPRP